MNNKNYIHHVPYLRNSKAYDHDFWHTFVKWWYLQDFFKFFQNFSGVKGQQITQNDKKFCLSCFMSQKPYIIWLSFMVHLCKMKISPDVFFHFFKSVSFWVVRVLKQQKLAQNDKNSVTRHVSGTILHMIFIYDTHV